MTRVSPVAKIVGQASPMLFAERRRDDHLGQGLVHHLLAQKARKVRSAAGLNSVMRPL